MKWHDLEVGDVVTHTGSHETCLLLEKDGNTYTWFVLSGESHLVWGSNPYVLKDTKLNLPIADWDVYRGAEKL